MIAPYDIPGEKVASSTGRTSILGVYQASKDEGSQTSEVSLKFR